MNFFADPLLKIPAYRELIDVLNTHMKAAAIGPSDAQKAHFAHSVSAHLGKRCIYIAQNEMTARRIYEDICFFDEEALLFPAKEPVLYNVDAYNRDLIFRRNACLDRILKKQYRFTVTSPEALLFKLLNPRTFSNMTFTLSVGDNIDIDKFIERLSMMGYEREAKTEAAGQFSVRGGIVDVYPVGSDNAYRAEFWGDDVDSLRVFDHFTQRSVENVQSMTILPASDTVLTQQSKGAMKKSILAELDEYAARHADSKHKKILEALKEQVDADTEKLDTCSWFAGIDRYAAHYPDFEAAFFDYVAEDVLVVVDEKARLLSRADNMILEYMENVRALAEKGQVLPSCSNAIMDRAQLERSYSGSGPVLMINSVVSERDALCFNIPSRQQTSYGGTQMQLEQELCRWHNEDYFVVVLNATKAKCERFCKEFWKPEDGVMPAFVETGKPEALPGRIAVMRGGLSKGFEYPTAKFAVVSESDISGKAAKKKTQKKNGKKITDFAELSVGDLVVHQVHGIGRYVGIEELNIANIRRDYIKVQYFGTDALYIPTTQLDLIQKYIGPESKNPKLNKLGGNEWTKTKERVKASLQELAGELIKLYAQRRESKGFAFSPDTVWQAQFEDKFTYEETEDQLRCIDEIKSDMESPRVMDRLLCGDVGYGKTEVAVRAMFKAVMEGKQVAYLVPTTVLAQQQADSIAQRMRDFPVRVASLSRFKTKEEQKKILKDTETGMSDILVGTHRILQKDVKFKDLGLLVIDEEQRFGVAHKERIKKMKPEVDTLVLSATPIPRTLHMSMTGIRDISIIEEPPEERYPVQTFVMELDNDIIHDAICRELARDGQVFYLSNSVKGIEQKTAMIRELVPEAKVEFAHGQMSENRLEDVMRSFCDGEINVLVCTTIIESGLDIPNANTIIVENADRLGLAQLYQIRGRVGRSNRLAYAYIMYRKDKILSETAEKRIQAIKEFTDFGAGYKIALRDLEIRGAGNILGPEQHGHMEAVGYDMYTRLLDEAVRELSGGKETKKEDIEVTIEIPVSAYIDPEYIVQDTLKIDIYKKIAAIADEDDVLEVRDELLDRFGDIPEETENLIDVAYISALAKRCGFATVSIKQDGTGATLQYPVGRPLPLETIAKASAMYGGRLRFTGSDTPYFTLKFSAANMSQRLNEIKKLLKDIAEM